MSNTNSDISIQNYQRNLITFLLFLMREGYLPEFKRQTVKADRNSVETYTDDEMQIKQHRNTGNMAFIRPILRCQLSLSEEECAS